MRLLIKKARVIDPKSKTDDVLDILVQGAKIIKISKNIKEENTEIINAQGLIACPGLVDIHAHFREPGFEYKETILSGSKAAAAGGFTSVCCMPNTKPVADNQGVVEFIISQNRKAGLISLFPIGAITRDSKGTMLSDIGDLKEAGVIALSDDGKTVMNTSIMRRAMEYAAMLNLPIISHCEDIKLSADGVMNEGFMSTKLGLKGIPRVSEISMIARDIELARFIGAYVHIAHVSCKESVDIIRAAKKDGIKVTCECTPHHFSLTEEALADYDTNTKVNPPLRTKEDVKAILKGLKDGVIDCIATDHAPHADSEKDVEFDSAPFGIIGLETALGLGVTELVGKNILSLNQLIEKMSYNPAKILNLGKGILAEGADADITIFDDKSKWQVDESQFFSKSKNSPFIGTTLTGRVLFTIAGGKKIFCR